MIRLGPYEFREVVLADFEFYAPPGERPTPVCLVAHELGSGRTHRLWQDDLQRLTEDLQADVDRERNDILGRSSQRMQEVVKKLAEEKGIDVVVDISNTVYFKPALEITTESIAAYDKAYPAK